MYAASISGSGKRSLQLYVTTNAAYPSARYCNAIGSPSRSEQYSYPPPGNIRTAGRFSQNGSPAMESGRYARTNAVLSVLILKVLMVIFLLLIDVYEHVLCSGYLLYYSTIFS